MNKLNFYWMNGGEGEEKLEGKNYQHVLLEASRI